jgi:hypothetical protein
VSCATQKLYVSTLRAKDELIRKAIRNPHTTRGKLLGSGGTKRKRKLKDKVSTALDRHLRPCVFTKK